MPLYELQCDAETCGDRQEVYLPMSQHGQWPTCPTCSSPTHQIHLASHQRAQRFEPIVFHESPDGRLRFPGRADAPVPDGFQRKEVRTFREYESFRRHVDHVESNKIEQANEAEHAYLHHIESVNRPDLRMLMQSMPEAYRNFARLAIEKGNARPRTFAPGFHVEAMEFDASNRPAWDDRDRNGRSRK